MGHNSCAVASLNFQAEEAQNKWQLIFLRSLPLIEDRVSGAQVIDGCLRFDESKGQYLKFTPSSSGNRKNSNFKCLD